MQQGPFKSFLSMLSTQGRKSGCSLLNFVFPSPNILVVATAARSEPPGRHGSAESLHRGVEEVLHAVRHPAQALLPAGDHADGETRQQQEDEHGGQHRTQGERRGGRKDRRQSRPTLPGK